MLSAKRCLQYSYARTCILRPQLCSSEATVLLENPRGKISGGSSPKTKKHPTKAIQGTSDQINMSESALSESRNLSVSLALPVVQQAPRSTR